MSEFSMEAFLEINHKLVFKERKGTYFHYISHKDPKSKFPNGGVIFFSLIYLTNVVIAWKPSYLIFLIKNMFYNPTRLNLTIYLFV